MGNDEPILDGKRVLEQDIEKFERKVNGPKNIAKHIEAKQNWINRESKRIESESAKEMQENIRVRKNVSVVYEEIERVDLLREGESTATSCLRRARRKFKISNNKN